MQSEQYQSWGDELAETGDTKQSNYHGNQTKHMLTRTEVMPVLCQYALPLHYKLHYKYINMNEGKTCLSNVKRKMWPDWINNVIII